MNKIKKIIIELMLIICSVFGCFFVVFADGEITLSLNNTKDTTQFICENMMPGDVNSKVYQVDIAHDDSLTLYFNIDINSVTYNLDKYLLITIKDENDDVIVNNRKINEFNEVGVVIAKDVDSYTYKVDVTLDETYGTGNPDCESLLDNEISQIKCDFSWYVKEEDYGKMVIPKTGIESFIDDYCLFSFDYFLLLLILIGLIALFIVALKKNTFKYKMTKITILVFLGFLICTNTTYALYSIKLDLNDLLFTTKKYDCIIVANNDETVISTTTINEYFEPGRSRIAEFKIKNGGEIDVYYRFYFNNTDGILMNVINVGIFEDKACTKKLYEIDGKDFNLNNSFDNNLDILSANQERTFYLLFKMNEDSGNEYQGSYSDFTIQVEAIQSKNTGGFNQ